MNKHIVILGPGHPLRGGLATFDERLAKAFQDRGFRATIYSFSLQYPEFMFPGTTQYSDEPPPENIHILSKVNSINPFNWLKVGLELKALKPDIIVVRFWLPMMGPALGTILRIAKKNRHTRVVAITDNIVPHEKRPGDTIFTRYFLKPCDAFIAMSEKVMQDLALFAPHKPATRVLHPLYDNFGAAISKAEARQHLGIPATEPIVLFFGFIRKYKGLDILFSALALLKQRIQNTPLKDLKLLVAGEFYEEEKAYRQQIEESAIGDMLIMKTGFIPNQEVRDYFCAADVVIQPYRNATQSGVTPLAYHFEKPMIVTNVGALPDYVPHEKAGLVAAPEPAALAAAIERYFELGEHYFIPHLREEKKKYSWDILVNAVLNDSPPTTDN
ncbi:MAG TPA: glycosyltransferase [Chitinophagaceae bacterium]|jgi:glycosyltransferase involved in cell wall biosynthesis